MRSTSSAMVLCLPLLFGCAGYKIVETAAPPLSLSSPPPAGMAKICVVRPQLRALSYQAVIRDNGNLVGATQGQTYFCYLAEPGAHIITTESVRQTEEARADARSGSSYFLKQRVDYGTESVAISNDWIDQQVAESAIRGSRYVTLSGAPHREALPQIGAVLPAASTDNPRRDDHARGPRPGGKG